MSENLDKAMSLVKSTDAASLALISIAETLEKILYYIESEYQFGKEEEK